MTVAGSIQPRPFSHRESGTDEQTWLLDGRWDGVPRCDLAALVTRYPRVVLVAPHPDDETLGLGATLADLAAAGVDVTVVVATHGGHGPDTTVRRGEGDAAIVALHRAITPVWWDLPDRELDRCEAQLVTHLGDHVDAGTLLLAPVECDGHADHDAVGRACVRVAARTGATLLHYPIWLWHWARPDDMPWSRLRVLAPSQRALHAKAAALECHRSQLAAADGDPIVGPAVRTRAQRLVETVMLPADPALAARADVTAPAGAQDVAAPFDAMYDDGDDDPWQLRTSFYEQRRHDLVMACLGRSHYRKVLDIGCATGELTRRLAERAEQVTGMDASPAALSVAAAHTPPGARVRWLRGAAPADLPADAFDLVVLSEVAYFLDGPDLLTTLRAVRRSLREGGELVVADWRHPTGDIPLDGPAAHRQVAAVLDLPLRARYEDPDLLIEVWGDPLSTYDSHRSRG